jgi:glycosyltransferase involved in cell wall biosynthesis
MTSTTPIRVLYYVAYFQRMAGANRSLFELVTNLPGSVTPLVLLAGEGMVAEAYRSVGIEVKVVPPGRSLNQFGKVMLKWSPIRQAWVAVSELLPYTFQLRKLIKELKPDIVHVNDGRGALLIGPAARLSGCPIVGHMRGEAPFGGVTKIFFDTVSDRIITVCSAIQSSLSPEARAKTVTVYNGTHDVSHKGQVIPWLSTLREQGKVLVCCFASIVPFKGHHHLIEAVAELNQRGWRDRAVFVCVGDFVPEYQEYQNWLIQRQQELNVDNLLFTGWQSDPFSFYRVADIAVLPSVSSERLHYNDKAIDVRGNEGFPRTHLEAMSFGLPIVGTAIAGVREQVEDGVNGFVVPPSDKLALADALEKLLADPTLRLQMGKAGRERVQSLFSTDAYVSGVMNVYKSLIPRLSDA